MSNDPMAEIKASFFVECEDLLESLQDALNVMDGGDADNETVNVVFRAVHSIKGGAGAFGLNALVAFAHRFETVLDELRSGRIDATPEAVKLFFQAADLLQDHVRAARDGAAEPDGAEAVLLALEELIGGVEATVEEPVTFAPMVLSFDFGGMSDLAADEPGPRRWRVTFSPRAELYTSGNEALLILRTLTGLGEASLTCNVPDDLTLSVDQAEVPRLSWTIDLAADLDRSDIEEVFDFVADVCALEIFETTGTEAPDVPAAPAQLTIPDDEADAENTPRLRLVVDEADHPAPPPSAPPVAERGKPAPSPNTPQSSNSDAGATVRVDIEKIDRLVNLVGELVINQAMLSQSVNLAGLGNAEVSAGLEAFMALTRDIQDSVMSVRAQPVKPLFQRMARIVREASLSVGKEVRLKTEGEATEVDKTVIERLADPLTHMIRNAVDHGLETPDHRVASGKSREGQITLSAFHRAGRILIEVADDGAGINRPKVLSIAQSKGLVPMDAQPTDSEIDNLLFLPGFSTADKVSALSGRGVGMDVVKSSITALGGRISIASEPGRGSIFSISLPLTLAVLDGMVVRAAGQTFVIPLSAIIETATMTADAIQRVGANAELLQIRGDLIPLVDLGIRLGFRPPGEINRNGIVLLTAQDNGSRAAIIVDAIMEQRQVVIKGLGNGFGEMPGVAAATILGDGQIALILDPADLVQKLRTSAPTEIALAG